jgi:hypothetical protein
MLAWASSHVVAVHPALDVTALVNSPVFFHNAMVTSGLSIVQESVHVSDQMALAALGLALLTIGFVTRNYHRKRKQQLAGRQEPGAMDLAVARTRIASEAGRTVVAE